MRKILQIFIAIIPLIVSFSTSDPTLSIRFLAFSFLVSGIIFYYLLVKKPIFKEVVFHPLMLAFAVIVLSYTISAFYNGFGSESVYVILRLFLLYVFTIILVHFVAVEGYKPLLISFLYFSLFSSLIYFFQLITNYSDITSIKSQVQRNNAFDNIAATMGHKNLLASIQFLILPILIYFFTHAKRLIKALSVLAIVMIILIFFQVQSRAVLFAFIIFGFSLFVLNKRILKKKHFVGIFLSGIILFGSWYVIMKYTDRYDAFVNEINKTLNITSSARYKLYSNSLDLIKENPIFGVGPGNWSVDIWKYGLYQGKLGRSFAQRPHNDFLWVFSEGGFIAGIAYILLFLILIKDAYYLHKNRNKEDGVFYSLLFSTFLGFGFISLFDFPLERFSHMIIFCVLASFVIAARVKDTNIKTPGWFKILLIMISFFSVYVASIRYTGEMHATNAINFKEKGRWNYVVKAIDKAYNKDYYEMENTSTPLLWYRGVAYFNQKRYDLAFQDFKASYGVNPYHVHVLNNLATSYQIKGDSKKAKQYYQEVFKVNHTFKEARVNLAAILFNEKRYEQALDVILQSEDWGYWHRKNENFQDNYDLYLKTIVNSWTNSIYDNANGKQRKALKKLKLTFAQKPDVAAKQAKSMYNIKAKKTINYLDALMLYEKDLKSTSK